MCIRDRVYTVHHIAGAVFTKLVLLGVPAAMLGLEHGTGFKLGRNVAQAVRHRGRRHYDAGYRSRGLAAYRDKAEQIAATKPGELADQPAACLLYTSRCV